MPTPANTPTPAPEATKPNVMPPTPSTPTTPVTPPTTTTPVTPPTTPAPLPPAEKPAAPALGIPGAVTPLLPDDSGIKLKLTSSEPTSADSGVLTVWVPNDAKVTINGMLTKSTGSKRHFVSYGLRPGYTYKYVVKAEVPREVDGKLKLVPEEQTVSLTAGEQTGVAFGFNLPSNEGLATAQ